MKYKELVRRVSETTGYPAEVVRNVLFAVPDVLVTLEEEEKARTPLGVFRMTKRKARTVTPPKGGAPVEIPAEFVVKMKAGGRMKRPV